VARRSAQVPLRRAGPFIRVAARISTMLLLVGVLYVGLVQRDIVRSPLDPAARGDLALARSTRDGLRVLFVGNSLTYRNDMPALVHELAAGDSAAAPVFTVHYAAPNWSLKAASEDDGLKDLLREVDWDVVVLQERSNLPSRSPDLRREEIEPFARALDSAIDAVGAETVLFMTWAYEHGDRRSVDGDSYAAMQERLREGYTDLAADLSAQIAPVGLAWAEALARDPRLRLWAEDGLHPSRLGSYLAACVFYGLITARDPTGSRFTAGLAPMQAHDVQQVAADVLASDEPRP
jgi:hypothetical protein